MEGKSHQWPKTWMYIYYITSIFLLLTFLLSIFLSVDANDVEGGLDPALLALEDDGIDGE